MGYRYNGRRLAYIEFRKEVMSKFLPYCNKSMLKSPISPLLLRIFVTIHLRYVLSITE